MRLGKRAQASRRMLNVNTRVGADDDSEGGVCIKTRDLFALSEADAGRLASGLIFKQRKVVSDGYQRYRYAFGWLIFQQMISGNTTPAGQ